MHFQNHIYPLYSYADGNTKDLSFDINILKLEDDTKNTSLVWQKCHEMWYFSIIIWQKGINSD